VNYRESYGLHASSGILFKPRVAAAWTRVRHAKSHPRCGADQGRARQCSASRQPRRPPRLGLRGRLRARHVGDAPTRRPDDFVVATGQSHSVRELCEVAFHAAGLNYEDHVVVDPKFIRPAEVDLLVGERRQGARAVGLEVRRRFLRPDRDDGGRGHRRPWPTSPVPTLEGSSVLLRGAVSMASDFPLLSGVDLELQPSSLTVLVGANGAGKTSLLRLLAGLVGLSAGEGWVLGLDLASVDRRQIRRRVGWLGHEGSFYDDLSVAENLTFAAKALGRPTDELTTVLDRVETHRASRHRRQSNSRPVNGDDSGWPGCSCVVPNCGCSTSPTPHWMTRAARFFDELLGDVVERGATVLVSAHDPLRSARLRPRTLVMAGGRIVSES